MFLHSDVHDVWINPKHTDDLVIATDGGAYLSQDRGASWRFVARLPIGQFYHVSYDLLWPYNVYGGLQDNSTWFGPSRRPVGVGNKHWQSHTGGDGFWAFVDFSDPDIIYDEIQGGNLWRIRRSTLESKDIRPSPRQGEPRYRFNWNTPIHIGKSSGALYYAAQFLFRSRDKGDSWERISPDRRWRRSRSRRRSRRRPRRWRRTGRACCWRSRGHRRERVTSPRACRTRRAGTGRG